MFVGVLLFPLLFSMLRFVCDLCTCYCLFMILFVLRLSCFDYILCIFMFGCLIWCLLVFITAAVVVVLN